MYFRTLLLIVTSVSFFTSASAQGYVSYESFSESKLVDELGNRYGSGGMRVVSAGYNISLSTQKNDKGQLKSWSATINASYAHLNNNGEATKLNPDNVLDAGVSLMYLVPISKRWNLMVMAGAGIYAPTDEINAKSILGSGGAAFIRKISSHVDLGIGIGLTNSYGPPMIMPMLYFCWQQSGRFNFKVDMLTGIKVVASTQLNKWFRIDLTAIEMDGMSAVMDIEGKSKIYSMMSLRSYLCPTIKLNNSLSIYGSLGGNWIRSISMTDRNLKAFFNTFKEENNDPYFRTSLRLSAGIKYCF